MGGGEADGGRPKNQAAVTTRWLTISFLWAVLQEGASCASVISAYSAHFHYPLPLRARKRAHTAARVASRFGRTMGTLRCDIPSVHVELLPAHTLPLSPQTPPNARRCTKT